MHLISDATGETLNTVARAAMAYYADYQPVEHIYALVRTPKQLARALAEIESEPGVVLFTLIDSDLRSQLEKRCGELTIPCISILDPVIASLAQYLNAQSRPQLAGQHALNAEYFRRIDALNFTMIHDDGQHASDLDQADVILTGISRSSKTPTSIYLANRGIKTANIPLVPNMPVPPGLPLLKRPLVVGLVASAERVVEIRRNRLLGLNAVQPNDAYIDREAVAEEIAFSRRLCARNDWPVIDVTRRSIEETAAAIIGLLQEHRRKAAEAD